MSQLKPSKVFQTNEADTISAIVIFLNLSGWHVWRNNTYGIYDQQKKAYRRLQYQQKGVADIIGFNKVTSQFIAVEIKIGSDTLKPDQIQFLNQVKDANGLPFVAHSFDDFLSKFQRKLQLKQPLEA